MCCQTKSVSVAGVLPRDYVLSAGTWVEEQDRFGVEFWPPSRSWLSEVTRSVTSPGFLIAETLST